jgi:CO/xanthine dehydrogenase Mo-binding subunit
MTATLSRRALLKTGSVLVVGFAIDGLLPRAARAQNASKPVDPKQVDSFLAIHPDGRVTIYTSKVDVGTGLRIAIAQMAAHELGMTADHITVVDGDTALCPDQGGTGGSTGLTRGGADVRRAAATARVALLARASARLQSPVADLRIADGVVRSVSGGASVSLAALTDGQPLSLTVDEKAPLLPAQSGAIGESPARPDVPAKCTGRRTYVHDVTVPGMLHARVIRPPAMGATLRSVDEGSIRSLPGVKVVRVRDFLAVVSPDEWAAVRGARELKAAWSDATPLPESDTLDRWARSAPVDRTESIVARGDAPGSLASAKTTLAATYFWPFQSHASLGPSCAVADIRGDGGTVWSASQGTHGLRNNLAKVFALSADRLRVIFVDGAGSYGTNGGDHVAADAVLLSKTLGQPVRVQWMRHDETGWDPKGPLQLLDLRAAIGDAGQIEAWDTQMWLPNNAPGARALLAADATGLVQEHGQGAGLITQNGDPPYRTAHVRVAVNWLKDTPLQLSNLRAPGKIANVFAVESFTDEIAARVGVDPVAFRLERLSDPRAIDVIKRTADAFGWTPRAGGAGRAGQAGGAGPAGGTGRAGRSGNGFAYARYKQSENYVAMAMEVTVDTVSGRVVVRRVVCAHDCGLVVNPDALKNQIEGCIVQTISRTLHEEVTFDRSRVTSVDWASYPILRFPDAPQVDVILVNRPDQPIVGAGEAATAPVAAAVANAIFDATGVRLRRVPFTPERVKAALAIGSTNDPRP